MRNSIAAALLCGIVILATSAHATQIIHYDNMPVTIELHEGEERSIQFGDHVRVGITKGMQIKKLFRIQAALGAVHILPHQTFEDKQRIQVQTLKEGRVVLLDLVSTKRPEGAAPLENIRIVLDSEEGKVGEQATASSENAPSITPVVLTRLAAQKLYGPTRLHREVKGVTQTALGVEGRIKVFKGDLKLLTASEAVLAYEGGGYYLVALHVRNISNKPMKLDYLKINLPFTHAVFQHHTLYPNGTPGDSTVLYLINDEPLKKTLYPWTFYSDVSELRSAEEGEE